MSESKIDCNISGYKYEDSKTNNSHTYLLPKVDSLVANFNTQDKRIFDLGCGNGSIGEYFYKQGYSITGVDPSAEGINQAQKNYAHLNLHFGSAYDELNSQYGQYPVVISLEVVEHVFLPRLYAKTLFNLVQPGGIAIVSTPYHGYLKNLVMSITGTMDKHFTALWDYGHIKFWSMRTLNTLLAEAGFSKVEFHRVGRIPPLAKSMIAVAYKNK